MIWYIALGSAVGGVLRHLVGGLAGRVAGPAFPYGTLLVNVTGCFLIGLVYRYGADSAVLSPEVRALLAIGFCGGYTTFSTFSYETIRLLEDGQLARAGTYVALSVVLSLAAALAGVAAGRELLLVRRG
jgi:CrcB protein